MAIAYDQSSGYERLNNGVASHSGPQRCQRSLSGEVVMRRFSFVLLFCLLACSGVLAQRTAFPSLPGWRDHARTYLTTLQGEAFDPARHVAGTRCVMLNNYPCIKQPARAWRGTPRPDGTDGARDGAGHAMFSHPKWSIVAAMQWFYRRTASGAAPRSAYALAQIYSPWCDTLGSSPAKKDKRGVEWGRSCGGREGPPAGFRGPLCGMPPGGVPRPNQCDACNCPSGQADYWLRGSGLRRDEDVAWFYGGKPTPALQRMIPRVIAFENGRYRPNARLMQEATEAFAPQ